MKLRVATIGTILALLPAPTLAGFVDTYASWQRLSRPEKVTYLTGAYDSLVTLGTDPQSVRDSKHFNDCVVRSRMSAGQMTTNVESFAATRPDLHGLPPQAALIQYLVQMCGPPPQ